MLSSNKNILTLLLRKMLNNKWMLVSLLIGNVLLLATVASIPMYGTAVLQRVLVKDLEQYQAERNIYTGRVDYVTPIRYSLGDVSKTMADVDAYVRNEMLPSFGVPLLSLTRVYNLLDNASPEIKRDTMNTKSVSVDSYEGIEEHIEITAGRMYSSKVVDGEVEAIVSRRTLDSLNVLLGESMTCLRILYKGDPLKLRIVGVFDLKDQEDLYWRNAPANMTRDFVIDGALFNDIATGVPADKTPTLEARWFAAFDYHAINVREVDKILAADNAIVEAIKDNRMISYTNMFARVLSNYAAQVSRFTLTLWVLQVPTFIFLCSFIFMVSKKIVELERNEIAVFKSRGASRMQIIGLYFYQGIIISLLSLIVGIPLGILICRTIGASNGFLDFVQRTALPVRLYIDAILYPLAACGLSILTMLIPAIRASKTTIVGHKQGMMRGRRMPFWKKSGVDVVALGLSIYVLYNYTMQGARVDAAGNVTQLDPVLFIGSSLFMIGAGLLILRLFPLLLKLIFFIGKRLWSPSVYASFLNVSRSVGDETFIMMFLILTVSIGIYYSQMARTINQNLTDRISYTIGADVTMQEQWLDNSQSAASMGGMSMGGMESSGPTVYYEPDFGKYDNLIGIDKTKVYADKRARLYIEGSNGNVTATLLGIHTKEFGQIAWMRNGLTPYHWYNYLNAMAKAPNAVLVSDNLRTKHNYKLGDAIRYRNKDNLEAMGIIYGFVSYFPSYAPTILQKNAAGLYEEADQYMIVTNLAYIQNAWGVLPYQVWMRTGGKNNLVYDFIVDEGIKLISYNDTAASIVDEKNQPLTQGTNGVLTVGFVLTLAVSMAGFLIYWILSIKGRVLQFGVFRAMGLSKGGVIGILINEQFLISLTAIAIGVLVGQLTSTFFVPLILIGYSSYEQVIPLHIVSEAADYIRLFGIIGAVLVACLIILGMIISKIRIAEALKLGEE